MTAELVPEPNDFDSAWKEALERFFPEMLALFFPEIHRQIDGTVTPEFLDKELQQVVRDADSGRGYVDKLVKVRACDGHETWVLLHLEVQGEAEATFAQRMYRYHYRLSDRYPDKDIVSLAILTDTRASFRPQHYERARWGCRVRYWMVTLPEALQEAFRTEVGQYEEIRNMALLSRGEYAALKQGLQQGLKEGEAAVLMRLLHRRFGEAALARYRSRIEAADAETLLEWSERLLFAQTPEEVFEYRH